MVFENIVGQNNIKSHLISNVEAGRTPHAQLFSGKSGYGPLPIAIAYAKYIIEFKSNTKASVDPLNHPDIHYFFPVVKKGSSSTPRTSKDYISEWREFVSTSSYGDLSEWHKSIDAGNKQGIFNVEEAKEIIKALSMKAFSGGHKVLILWHAEKMNLSCSNKLLKWIEEPNENTSIILITEESSSLLKTIESRCQEIRVGRIKPSDIESGLIKRGANNIIAKKASLLAEGDFFNALKIISSLDGNENFEQLFIEWVRTAFGAKSNKKSIARLMQWSDRVSKLGRELEKDFLNYSLEFFRQAVLLNYGGKDLVSLKINDDSFSLEKFSAFIDGTNIEKISEEIESAIFHIERNANGKIVLTDLSIKLTRLLHIKK